MVVVVREIEAQGDKVITSLEWRAVGNASGLEVSSEWTTVHTIPDGQIVRLQFFYDRDAAMEACAH
jgi:ketosteroid isomerase-like protein